MKTQIQKTFLLFAFLLLSIPFFAQQSAEKYVIETNYLQYLPGEYANDTTKLWPMVVFLHGAGETGTDIEKVKVHGLPKLIEAGKQFPFIVISPQSRTHGWKMDELYNLLNDISGKLRIDPDRVYLTGLSMGGYGTWGMAMNYPGMFAAIIPICGGWDDKGVTRLRNMPVWCFHGDADDVVPISESEKMVNALKKYRPDVKFTVYAGVGHDSWTETYENEAIYDWLLQHKRHKNKQISLDSNILKKYAGTYRSDGMHEMTLKIEGDGLKAWYGQRQGPYYLPKSENEFYDDDYSPDYIRFEKDEQGNIKGLTMMQFREHFFEKI